MTPFVYACTSCGRNFPRDEVRYLCPSCGASFVPGSPLTGVLRADFDYGHIRRRFDRQRPDWDLFCAVERRHFPAYPAGGTPFFRSDRLQAALGLDQVWIKHDGQNPSGSLKDRASLLVVAEAARLGETTVVTASTGNAASALAAVCAAAGRRAVIFVPVSAPPAKLAQIRAHGAKIMPVRGTYDDAFRMSLEYTAAHGGLNRNTAYHPLTVEGKKTVGFEIYAQNGMRSPDVIVVPVGDGVILTGVAKAFSDLAAAGLTRKLPRLVCVQAQRSAAIHHYIVTGRYRNAERPATIADSISVGAPANAHWARQAVLASGGCSVTVSDREIMRGQRLLAVQAGVFAEPAAAAPAAALAKLIRSGQIDRREQVVLLVTGHGLKDTAAIP